MAVSAIWDSFLELEALKPWDRIRKSCQPQHTPCPKCYSFGCTSCHDMGWRSMEGSVQTVPDLQPSTLQTGRFLDLLKHDLHIYLRRYVRACMHACMHAFMRDVCTHVYTDTHMRAHRHTHMHLQIDRSIRSPQTQVPLASGVARRRAAPVVGHPGSWREGKNLRWVRLCAMHSPESCSPQFCCPNP